MWTHAGTESVKEKVDMDNKLVVFKGKEIRRTLHDNKMWFAIVDVVSA